VQINGNRYAGKWKTLPNARITSETLLEAQPQPGHSRHIMKELQAFAIAGCDCAGRLFGRTAPAKAEPDPSSSAPHTIRYELNLDELKYARRTPL
jgi:hypothetical protein